MKKKYVLMLTLLVTVAVSGAAFAGYTLSVPVTVTATTFSGALGSARNSADATQYIFCKDNGTSAFCGARDSAGTTKSCTTTAAAHLDVVRSMVDTSRIDVTFSGGTCTSVSQVNGSYYDERN